MTPLIFAITVIRNLLHDRHIGVQTNHTDAQSILYINSKSLRDTTRAKKKINSAVSCD